MAGCYHISFAFESVINSMGKMWRLGRIERKKKRGQQRMGWFYSITDSMNRNLNKLWEGVEDRGACPWRGKSWTLLSN